METAAVILAIFSLLTLIVVIGHACILMKKTIRAMFMRIGLISAESPTSLPPTSSSPEPAPTSETPMSHEKENQIAAIKTNMKNLNQRILEAQNTIKMCEIGYDNFVKDLHELTGEKPKKGKKKR